VLMRWLRAKRKRHGLAVALQMLIPGGK